MLVLAHRGLRLRPLKIRNPPSAKLLNWEPMAWNWMSICKDGHMVVNHNFDVDHGIATAWG